MKASKKENKKVLVETKNYVEYLKEFEKKAIAESLIEIPNGTVVTSIGITKKGTLMVSYRKYKCNVEAKLEEEKNMIEKALEPLVKLIERIEGRVWLLENDGREATTLSGKKVKIQAKKANLTEEKGTNK